MATPSAKLLRISFVTAAAMICFAANSVLARWALREEEIDGGTFTAVRLVSGAIVLGLLVGWREGNVRALGRHGSWTAASALLGYAFAFSFAYLWLDVSVGALVLFAAIQITMIAVGIMQGERPRRSEWFGLALAFGGLVYLVSPGLTAPSLSGAILMAASGVAWGLYSLAVKGRSPSAIAAAAGNFGRSSPVAVGILVVVWWADRPHASQLGLGLAVISGAVTSGFGHAIWYAALRGLTPSRAAIVQLTVPVIASLAGVTLLDEQMTWRLALAGAAILGGVALALSGTPQVSPRS